MRLAEILKQRLGLCGPRGWVRRPGRRLELGQVPWTSTPHVPEEGADRAEGEPHCRRGYRPGTRLRERPLAGRPLHVGVRPHVRLRPTEGERRGEGKVGSAIGLNDEIFFPKFDPTRSSACFRTPGPGRADRGRCGERIKATAAIVNGSWLKRVVSFRFCRACGGRLKRVKPR